MYTIRVSVCAQPAGVTDGRPRRDEEQAADAERARAGGPDPAGQGAGRRPGATRRRCPVLPRELPLPDLLACALHPRHRRHLPGARLL